MAASPCFRWSMLLHNLNNSDRKFKAISRMRMWSKLLPGVVAPAVSCWLKQIRCDAKIKIQTIEDMKPATKIDDTRFNASDSVPESFSWISSDLPTFPVEGDKVTVLSSPKEFYETLMIQTKKASRRITMASLYLGTGQLEKELVSEMRKTLINKNKSVEMLMVLDHTRGLRGHPNSCTMLQPLLENPRMNVALFHTPRLRGLLKYLAPDRWNELFGIQHMKVFVFDDNVLITGANLSQDYFTNRQDRYLLFENCPSLADFLHRVVSAVASFSLQLDSNGNRKMHPSWTVHPFEGDEAEFKAKSRQTLMRVLETEKKKEEEKGNCDTFVTPLLQFGPMGIVQDELFTKRLLISTDSNARAVMATGYFNLTHEYKKTILNGMTAPISIIMASPKVNGFYKARGVAGAIPSAYTNLAKEFYHQISCGAQQHRIRLFEYERDNWTFHSKGLWLYPSNEDTPFLTMIGSPNFGHRSVFRDLELQFSVVTVNPRLRNQLQQEEASILKRSLPVTAETYCASDRSVPLWVRLVTRFYRDFF